MRNLPWLLLLLLVALIALLLYAAHRQSIDCAARGGELVLDHWQPIVITTGKTTSVSMMPVYRCEVPR